MKPQVLSGHDILSYLIRIDAACYTQFTNSHLMEFSHPARWWTKTDYNNLLGEARNGHVVYAIRSSVNKVVKIGTSINSAKRLRALTTACPFDLTVEGVLPGGYQLESWLHRVFAARRTRGEWFQDVHEIPAVLSFVREMLSPSEPVACSTEEKNQVDAWLARKGVFSGRKPILMGERSVEQEWALFRAERHTLRGMAARMVVVYGDSDLAVREPDPPLFPPTA